MKPFARLSALLGLAAVFGASAVLAQTPPAPMAPKTTTVKAHSYMNKKGHMVNVKAHTRMMPTMKPKMTMVKAHSYMNKKGTMVNVKAHTRMLPKKTMKPATTMAPAKPM